MKKLFLLFVLISPSLAKAQAFTTGYVGDKHHAMGNAGVGLALDASSMTKNPASISFLSGNSVSAGGAVAIVNTAYLDSNNFSVSKTNSPIGTPFHVNAVYRVSDSTSLLGKFTFGLGIGTPYGGAIKWASDWTGRNSIIAKSLGSLAITPTVSYKINDQLSFGACFAYSESKLHVENAISVDKDALVVLDFTSRGYGFGAGLYYKLSDELSLGLGYMSQVNSKSYKGTAAFTVPSSIDTLFPSGKATFKSSVPQAISLGASYKLNEKLTLAFDAEYIFWKCFDTTVFVYTEATASSAVSSTRIPTLYKNTVSLRLGGQYQVMDNLVARAGFSFEQTPMPVNYVYPDLPDANRLNYTVGASYSVTDAFSVDLSYRFTDMLKRETRNVHSGMSGTYKTYANITGLSLNYKF